MRIWRSVQVSLALLSDRDRHILVWVTLLQFLISLLDLIGILLLGAVAALAASAVTGTSFGPGIIGNVLSDVNDSVAFIVALACASGLALILKSILGLLLTRRTFRFLANRQAMVAGSLAARLLNRPLLEVQAKSSQEISIALTSGVNALTLTTLGQAVVVFSEISLVAILFFGLIFVDPLVAAFTVVFFGTLVAVLQFLLGTWARNLGRRATEADVGSISAMQHALRVYREVTVSGRRTLFISRFQSIRWDAARVLSDTFILNQVGKYVFEIGLVVGASLLALLVSLTKDLSAGIAIITIFLAASARVFPSLLRMQSALANIRGAEGTAEVTIRLLNDLNAAEMSYQPPTIPNAVASDFNQAVHKGFPNFISSVDVSSVTINYPGESKPALDTVSLSILPNQSVAIVGSTGAGKSTLADVILGVLIPDSGHVRISGVEPYESVQLWPGAMSYVPQDVAVLTGSVRENVALGIPAEFIDDTLVWEALERAHLAKFLRSAQEGLNTSVGENGVQFSGGQRQRLGIARALYSRPRLLVLDEATSALDAETEQLITQTLDNLIGDVTIIVIAHRLTTVRHCDQIVYLSAGRIVGRGSFDQVREQVPDFDRQAKLLGL